MSIAFCTHQYPKKFIKIQERKRKQAGAEQCQAQAKLEIGYKLSLDEHI